MSDNTSDFKRCTFCGELKPATSDYFFRSGNGLLPRCKVCENARKKRWLEANPERAKHNRHNLYIKHREKALAYSRGYQKANREKYNERARKRYRSDPDRAKRIQQRYREKNPERAKEIYRRYRRNHPDKARETQAKWTEANRDKVNTKESRKRARKRSLPNTFTAQEWQNCLHYFGNCCAVCGRPRGLDYKIAMDHWIPLSSPGCPGTVATNMVPLCHGIGGCNNSKCDRDPQGWLLEKFGERKALEILERIPAYFRQLKGD